MCEFRLASDCLRFFDCGNMANFDKKPAFGLCSLNAGRWFQYSHESRLGDECGGCDRCAGAALDFDFAFLQHLDDGRLTGVAEATIVQLHDAGVPTWAVLEARADFVEELLENGIVLFGELVFFGVNTGAVHRPEERHRLTAIVQRLDLARWRAVVDECSLLGERDESFDERTKLFGLRDGRLDRSVREERAGKVPEESEAVAGRPVKVPAFETVAHETLKLKLV